MTRGIDGAEYASLAHRETLRGEGLGRVEPVLDGRCPCGARTTRRKRIDGVLRWACPACVDGTVAARGRRATGSL